MPGRAALQARDELVIQIADMQATSHGSYPKC
jgi:hypothetical protein